MIEDQSRSGAKRRAILEAATNLFLSQGYDGTSMDQVAAQAGVSKQTVYKHFADKDRLFAEIVLAVAGSADAFVDTVGRTLERTSNVERDLRKLARAYVRAVMQARVIQLRRLVIGEAARFPGLGREYYGRGPERVLAGLASCFEQLTKRGLLRAPDALLAAQHYAFLILSIPLDRALMCGEELSAAELDRLADAGTRVFLAAYGA